MHHVAKLWNARPYASRVCFRMRAVKNSKVLPLLLCGGAQPAFLASLSEQRSTTGKGSRGWLT
jgi:hypothetical protein